MFNVDVAMESDGSVTVGKVGALMAHGDKLALTTSRPKLTTCQECGRPGTLRCGGCRAVTYCSGVCQKVRPLGSTAVRAGPTVKRKAGGSVKPCVRVDVHLLVCARRGIGRVVTDKRALVKPERRSVESQPSETGE